jgi:thiamine-phosphate pyrophosphorylase
MRFEFTPAAERALAAAAAWQSRGADELHVPEVLLGLVAEPECRAALLPARLGIDSQAVLSKFSSLTTIDTANGERTSRFADEWTVCLHTAESLLVDHPRPLVLATEHLLLGIAATPGEVADWLAESGLNVADLEAEVHRLSGCVPGPLPLEPLDLDPTGDEADPFDAGQWPAHEQLAALRIIDAAANRAAEGLRIIEDYLRFALDDRHLTGLAKQLRHDLAAALQVIPTAERHAARETQSDVGTDVSLPSEQSRAGTTEVVRASFQRALQALRSLEEYSKTVAPDAAAVLEQLRYRAYTLERVVGITSDSLARLADARLYVLLDGRASNSDFGTLAESLVLAGVSMIQLRDKRLSDRELLARARRLVEIARDEDTSVIVNDRPDIAVLAGADGVHVGQDELPVKDARRILGPCGLIGVSTHSIEQARTAVMDGANYIGVGPTFPSATKEFAQFTGTELLREVQREIRLPAFAIGGITPENLDQVLASGIARVAVSRAILEANDPAAAARQFLAALTAGA